jgi:hypothetical protein
MSPAEFDFSLTEEDVMNMRKMSGTVMAGLVLASLVAPMAYADMTPRRTYYRQHEGSSVGPAIGGLVAGLLIGSQIHSQPVVQERVVYVQRPVRERVVYAQPDYESQSDYCAPPGYNDYPEDCNYYDPYHNGWYGKLDQCSQSAARYAEGPRFVVAISGRTGQCLNTFRWTGSDWRACGADARWNGCSQNDGGYRQGWKNNQHDNRGGRGHGRWSSDWYEG